MAVAQNTVIIDDVEYKPGEQLPQLGSIHRVFKDGGKRHYEGLAKDSDKLPLYVANNSSCFMTDTGEYYKFDESKKLWYKPDKIEQSKVTPIEVYGVLNGKIQQVSEDVEGIATPLLYKGSVSNISQLPLSPKIGWMYNISEKSIYGEAGMNVAWTGEIWDTLGPAIDMAPYLREDSEIITSLKTKTENLESANYTDRGTLADTDAFLINDGTGMKKSVLSKLSDFVLNKIADKVFAKLQTNDKTILGAINELNSKTFKGSVSLISYDNDESYVTAVFSINPSQSCNPCAINIANRVCVFFLNGYVPKLLGFSMTSNVRECFFSGNGVTNITLTIKFGNDNYLSEDQCKTATVMSYIIK